MPTLSWYCVLQKLQLVDPRKAATDIGYYLAYQVWPLPSVIALEYFIMFTPHSVVLRLQGGDNLLPRRLHARLMLALCPWLRWKAPHVEPRKRWRRSLLLQQQKQVQQGVGQPMRQKVEKEGQGWIVRAVTGDSTIRVGFISEYFREHSVSKLMEGVITRLPELGYNVVLLLASTSGMEHVGTLGSAFTVVHYIVNCPAWRWVEAFQCTLCRFPWSPARC